MTSTFVIQQTSNIDVVGVRKGSIECPTGTWQQEKGSGNPEDKPVCSDLDKSLCFGYEAHWANPVRLNNGSVVSLDGKVACETDQGTVDEVSKKFFIDNCILESTRDCPKDIFSINPSDRNKPMKNCNLMTILNNANPKTLTHPQEACIDFEQKNPESYSEFVDQIICTSGIGTKDPVTHDCMCINPEATFLIEGGLITDSTKFWNNLKSLKSLYNERGSWLKACNVSNYINSPLIVSKSTDLNSTCKSLDNFLNSQLGLSATRSDLERFKDLSTCYINGKLTGNNNNNNNNKKSSFSKYFWYTIALVGVVLIVFVLIYSFTRSKKKKKKV